MEYYRRMKKLTKELLTNSLSFPKAKLADAFVNSGRPAIGAYSLSRFLALIISSALNKNEYNLS